MTPLFLATICCGLALFLIGLLLFQRNERLTKALKAFPRSKKATAFLMAIAIVWFSSKILTLGPSDFGDYKVILLFIFLGITLSSFYFVPDFLGTRALAGILLLTSSALLEVAFMKDPSSRLFLVSFAYFLIVGSLFLGASPYLIRDLINKVYSSKANQLILGILLLIYGTLLLLISFSYYGKY